MSEAATSSKPTVEIQYCVPCGHLPRAMDVQKSVLERFGLRIDGVKLKTGEGGVFVISVDGEKVYEKPAELDLERVLGEIQKRVPAAA